MKKLLCMLLALMMVLAAVTSLVACGGDSEKDKEPAEDNKEEEKEDEKEDDKEEEDDESEITVPDGYTLFDNGKITFAYPEKWTKTEESGLVMISDGTGNSVNVSEEAKTTAYDELTKEEYEKTYVPVYESMGMTVTNVSLEHTETNGLKIVKVAYDLAVSGVSMQQVQYFTTVGNKTYGVTITLVTEVADLAENVFATLSKKA